MYPTLSPRLLTLANDRSWIKISVARAFPLSDPDHYVGFLDAAGKDMGMLYDPALLDSSSRHIVEEELERRPPRWIRLKGVPPACTTSLRVAMPE
jgi:hypothetical protein